MRADPQKKNRERPVQAQKERIYGYTLPELLPGIEKATRITLQESRAYENSSLLMASFRSRSAFSDFKAKNQLGGMRLMQKVFNSQSKSETGAFRIQEDYCDEAMQRVTFSIAMNFDMNRSLS